jgi:iron complex outermembrane receptor protein
MKTSLFVSVALLAFPTAALAQDPAGETWVDQLVVTAQPNSFAAEAAVTGTRTPTPLTEVPQSVQVLNRTLIEEQELQ